MMCCLKLKEQDSKILRSNEIDNIIRADAIKAKRHVKILLLGAGESGKSTVLKQMRLLHAGGFSEQERKQWRVVIFNNLIQSFQIVLREMEDLARTSGTTSEDTQVEDPASMEERLPYVLVLRNSENQQHVDTIIKDPQIQIDQLMPLSCLEALSNLWQDPQIQEAIHRGNEYALSDNLTYFCTDLARLFNPDYIPTDQDILRARLRTRGISETTFDLGQFTYRMFDVGGQRSERKKWIGAFESIHMILFLAAISAYDQVLIEDRDSNQMTEALTLFASIAHSHWFTHTSIILFLNKIDLFREKIKSGESPIARYFPDFVAGQGGGGGGGGRRMSYKDSDNADVKAGQEFFAERFREAAPGAKIVYVHYTNATDTDLLRRAMESVQDMIIQKNLDQLIF